MTETVVTPVTHEDDSRFYPYPRPTSNSTP